MTTYDEILNAVDADPATVIVSRGDKKISTEQKSETVILDLSSGVYHGLNEIGNSIWNCIEKPKKLSDIYAELMAEYDVSESQCSQDVMKFLRLLHGEGLVTVEYEKSS